MPRKGSRQARRSRMISRGGGNITRRERNIVSANAPTLTTINLNSGSQARQSCAVFNVCATITGLCVNSGSVPMNICIPANPLRGITQSAQGSGQSISQQSDMTSISALFDEFRVDGMAIHYQPSSMVATNNIYMGAVSDYDSEPAAGVFATLKTLMEYENGLFMNPNQEAELVFVPAKRGRATTPWLSTADSSTVTLGGVGLALWNSSANVTQGSIVIKWRIIARGNVF